MTHILDLSELYPKLRDAAHAAVASGGDFGLTDIMDEEAWLITLTTGFGDVLVLAVVEGAGTALQQMGRTSADLPAASMIDTQGLGSTAADLDLARGWLGSYLTGTAPEQVQGAISDVVDDRGWRVEPGRLSSLLLAVLLVGGVAAAHPELGQLRQP